MDSKHHFKTVKDTERLYRYDLGVYLDDGETILKELLESEFGDRTSNRLVADVVGKVKRRTYVDRDLFNNKHIINVRNGLLDLETLQLHPHTPDYLSTAQIDVVYEPEAKALKIQKFLSEVAQPGDVDLIEEIVGWLLWPDYNVHKAIML
jgi:putative DNA primase/helicase